MKPPPTVLAGAALATAALLVVAAAAPALGDPALEWQDLYDGGAQYIDTGSAALCDAAGNLVIGGESAVGEGGIDLLVRKPDRDTGATPWRPRYARFAGNDVGVAGPARAGAGDLLLGGTRLGCFG